MSFLESQEFWLSVVVIIGGAGAIWAAYKFGKTLSERELSYWFRVYRLFLFDKNSSQYDRKQALQEFSEAYRGYLRERNDFWEKYGQITVSVVIIVVLSVLLLTKTISPEAGLPILSAVGGFAIAKTANVSNQNRSSPSGPEG
ncbi:hypothetical protein [Thiopseudomonas alkaliphila]|uniref:hypothetical protein n=1 Tax=Thiopseudomonas alkaliphila TaxID=1697053 RepID=UPI00069D9BFE|nr:hypothetical protein [Thiopseudomonas alkaliphila]AKX52362.1 hypothetical protein AKN91_00740 [Thiopseudomonas alkaliphila]